MWAGIDIMKVDIWTIHGVYGLKMKSPVCDRATSRGCNMATARCKTSARAYFTHRLLRSSFWMCPWNLYAPCAFPVLNSRAVKILNLLLASRLTNYSWIIEWGEAIRCFTHFNNNFNKIASSVLWILTMKRSIRSSAERVGLRMDFFFRRKWISGMEF